MTMAQMAALTDLEREAQGEKPPPAQEGTEADLVAFSRMGFS